MENTIPEASHPIPSALKQQVSRLENFVCISGYRHRANWPVLPTTFVRTHFDDSGLRRAKATQPFQHLPAITSAKLNAAGALVAEWDSPKVSWRSHVGFPQGEG